MQLIGFDVVVKDKIDPRTSHEGQRGVEYSSTLSLTLMLDGGGWSVPCSGHFTPRKET